jgi:alpha-galactosidase
MIMLCKWEIKGIGQTGKIEKKGSCEVTEGENRIDTAVPAMELQKVQAVISLSVSEQERIFMNGYQTWTACPEYSCTDRIKGMQEIPSVLINKYGFNRYGDYDFVEYPYQKGITQGETWCYFRKGNVFRLYASIDEHNGYTIFHYDSHAGMLTIDRDCAGLHIEGNFTVFDFYYGEGSEQHVFDEWFSLMKIQRHSAKLYGYSSWYNRYQNINEEAMRQDMEGCTEIFQKNDLFQIDDGWEKYVGDWLEADSDKFPNGMKKMADSIHAKGYRAGLWLAPFAAEEKSELYRSHKDWFVQEKGQPVYCGSNWSGFYALDFDKPEVQAYISKALNQVLNEWGYDLVKLDFLYAAAMFGSSHETRAGRMIRAMKFLREVCGTKLILGCGVPTAAAFGYVDYCRIGCDVSLDWDDVFYMRRFHRERVSTKNAVGNIVSRRELNNRAYGSDPDVFFLRTDNIKLTEKQKDDLAMLDALLADVFLTSDDPSRYTDAMKEKYRIYRHLSGAEVLNTSNDENGILISYELDGKLKSVRLFEQ